MSRIKVVFIHPPPHISSVDYRVTTLTGTINTVVDGTTETETGNSFRVRNPLR